MNPLLHWLTSPEWALIVKALLHSLWQGALIAVAIALVLRRIANPAARYRFTLAGLGAVMAAALVTWGVLNAPRTTAPAVAPTSVPETITPPAATGPVDKIVVAANWQPAKPQAQWTAWLALAWLLGASVMLGRASVKVAGAEHLRRSCQPLNEPRINELVAEARRAVKLTRQVRLAVTNQLTSPAVVGVLVPTLILPLSLITTLSPEQLRFILLHELAHIRRGDYLANLFQLFAEALLFFNPAVWWLSHQIRREREACCDALAIELSGAPADYARTLVSVAETILQPSPAAAPAFGNDREPSSLADRVQRVLVPGYRPSLRLTWRAMIAALIAGGVLLGLLATGTRQTVAATAALLAPNSNSAHQPAEPSTTATKPITATPLSLNPVPGPQSVDLVFGPEVNLFKQPIIVREEGDYEQAGRKTSLAELRDQIASRRPIATNSVVNVSAHPKAPLNALVDLTKLCEEFGASVRIQPDVSPATGLPQTGDTNLFSRTFKISAPELARLTGNVGPVMATNRLESARAFFAQAGVDVTAPGRAMFFKDTLGWLFVRATATELETIEQILSGKTAIAPNSKSATEASKPINAPPMSLSQGAMITYSKFDVTTVTVLEDGRYLYRRANLDLEGLRARLVEFTTAVPNLPFDVLTHTNAPAQSVSNVVELIAELGAKARIEPLSPPASVWEPITETSKVAPVPAGATRQKPSASVQSSRVPASNDTNLFTRTFKVDPKSFFTGLENVGGLKATNVHDRIRAFFTSVGADLEPPKAVYFNDRLGGLLVRATLADLDIIEQAIQLLNQSAPQVNIRAKFVEVPMSNQVGKLLENLLPAATNVLTGGNSRQMLTNGFAGIITDSRAKAVFKALEQTEGVDILTMPEVTTLSGRQAQLQVVDIRTVVTGATSIIINGVTTNGFQTSALPFGPVLDVIPYVSADGYTVQMTIIPTITEFLGYDRPDAALTEYARTNSLSAALPLPRYRVRQLTTSALVWDGQTIVLGGFISEMVTPQPDGSEIRKPDSKVEKKQLFIFITPTIIDPAGNRVNIPADGIPHGP